MIVVDRFSINCNWIPLDRVGSLFEASRRRGAMIRISRQVVSRRKVKRVAVGENRKKVCSQAYRAWLCADHISETFRTFTNRISGSCEVTQLFSFILVEWQLTTPSAMNLWFLLNSRSLARCRVRVKFYRAEDRRVFG